VVERATEADWERVKAVRLAALAESPSAFGSTLVEENTYDETDWREWCRDTATFLAVHDGVPIGIAAGIAGTSHDGRKLIAMWLHPRHRGTGVSKALLAAVRDWAHRDGATTLILWVTRSNHAAAELYQGVGFSEQVPPSRSRATHPSSRTSSP
jgi:GNAT superfamily N-acetyltransferase